MGTEKSSQSSSDDVNMTVDRAESKPDPLSSSSSSESDSLDGAMPPKPENVKVKKTVYFFAFIAALSGLTFGYDIGGSGGTFVMPSFRQFFSWDDQCFWLQSYGGKTWKQADYRDFGFPWPEDVDFRNDIGSDTCQDFFSARGIAADSSSPDAAGVAKLYDPTVYGQDATLASEPCHSCCCGQRPDSDPHKEENESGDISFLETIGCMVGALTSSVMADIFGRKLALASSSSIFIVGAVIQTACVSSHAYVMMITGRLIGGFGIGAMATQATIYQAEIAPEKIRGLLVTLQQMMITTGIVSASLINLGLQRTDVGWRFSYGGNMFLAAAMIVLLFFSPESPSWLINKKNNKEKAIKNMRRLRNSEEEVQYEIYQLVAARDAQAKAEKAKWTEIFTNKFRNRIRMFTVCALHTLQQLSGINAIMFFGPTIVTIIFGVEIGQYGGLIFNSVNFLATFICVYAVDRWGRIPLLLAGTAFCFFGQLMAAILACPFGKQLNEVGTEEWLYEYNSGAGWGIIIGICIFIIGFAFSFGPLAWVYGAEALNNRTKALGSAIGSACNWAAAALIAKLFPLMLPRERMGIHGCFFFFASTLLFSGALVSFMIPETSGVPAEKIDDLFMNMKIGFLGAKSKKQKW